MKLTEKKDIIPPIAKKVNTELIKHGDKRIDPYYWMKLTDEQKNADNPDEQTKEVVAYLEAENEYREAMMSHLGPLENTLFEEIKGRIKQDDSSVPYFSNGYFYITRYEQGKEYPIYSRKNGSLNNTEEIMLDVNEMASGYEYYHIAGRKVSTDNKILAFAVDRVSRRQYDICFKNLETGEILEEKIPNTTGSPVWANDSKTVFYTKRDHTLRSYKIFRHTLGTPTDTDVEVYHEKDDTFNAFVFKTRSSKYIVIGGWATLSQEYYTIDADHPENDLQLFQARERKLEYSIAHHNDQWFIRTNKDGAENFKIMTTDIDDTSKENWKDYIAHRPDVYIDDLAIFESHLVLSERVEGISTIRILPFNGDGYYIDFGESAYTSYIDNNPEYKTAKLRVGYTSMTTPNSIYDFDIKNRTLKLMKEQEVLGDFDKDDYQSERIMVPSRDGIEVPVSIVYKKGFTKNGKAPFLQYAYGSYGYSIDPYFSSARLSLLDRGFGYAIAHIRGGQELGRNWYESGKFLNKKNTFRDFIDVGKYLVEHKYASDEKLFAMGGSAGGLLMGAVVNMEPALWKGVIAAVPFVDVVTTMLDESIPLTTGEYDEWGNPNEKEYYDYIKSYSPYDNIEKKDYPSMLITTGYHDSQVQYWEPAKWIAKLRDLKTDNNPLLMYCNMSTGHGGASGRFRKFKEVAMEYAYLLDLAD